MLGDENSVLEADGPLIWALDDEPMTLALLEDVLRPGGYRYEGFLEQHEMFEVMTRRVPDLLLLDWMLPGSSGHDVLRHWMARWPDVPVIVVTALSGESVLLNAFESGACDVVRKPFDVTELLVRVHRHLTQRSQTHSEQARMGRQDRLVAFSCELMRCADVMACWDALARIITEQVDAKLFSRRGDELCAHATEQVFDLSMCERPWRMLMQGEGVWLTAGELEKLGVQGRVGCVIPLHDGAHLLGVMWWPGERRSSTVEGFLVQVAQIMMTMLARFEREHHVPVREADALHGATREFLDRIIEASPDAIVAADRQGRIMLFNGAAERILEWDHTSAIGDDVRRLYRDGVAYQIMARLQADEEGGWGKLSKCRAVLLTRARDMIPVELSAALIVRDGEVLGTVGLFRDIRDRIAIEGQLERATQDLAAHREQVVMAEMAGATAHELNQPLTSMLNYVEVLKLDEQVQGNARSKRAVEVIERDVKRLAEIVKHIGQITQYRTRSYVDNTRILDLGEEDT